MRSEFPWGTERDYPFRIMLVKVTNWQQDETATAAEKEYNDGAPSLPIELRANLLRVLCCAFLDTQYKVKEVGESIETSVLMSVLVRLAPRA